MPRLVAGLEFPRSYFAESGSLLSTSGAVRLGGDIRHLWNGSENEELMLSSSFGDSLMLAGMSSD